jgi:threonine dehydrogenase-like Zn-dependent dehydrogenase
MQLWNWRGIDVINAHEREEAACLTGMRSAVATSASGNLNLSPLYTHTFPLQELPTAMQLLAERPEGFLKSLIIMEQNSFY